MSISGAGGGLGASGGDRATSYFNSVVVAERVTSPAGLPARRMRARSTPQTQFSFRRGWSDSQGIFTYAMPHEGWWGFSALTEAKEKMDHQGEKVPVELGAVLWVYAKDMK